MGSGPGSARDDTTAATSTELPWATVDQALAEEWCNGCHQPRSSWGPVCPGMTQGDWTHYHSRSWWLARLDTRTPELHRTPTAILEESVEEWVRNG